MNVTVIGSASAVSAEERALRDLYVEHGPALYSYVLHMLGGDSYRTEDILQETLLRCWNKQVLVDDDGMALRPWMFRVARNLVIDAHRARKSRPEEVSGNSWLCDVCAEVDDIERMLSSMLVRDALRSLTPAHREALQATIFADRTTQQAAEALGIPQGTVKSRVYYALRSLKSVLEDSECGEPGGGQGECAMDRSAAPARR
ncbi:sigma-70 family RNA polymerase sigma factor [Streptomyces sp. C1-2]|uniref:sigma-70 family RNA polymerase sigma factor n=1 Tax=Streptomyces sp. C1-2 TaxID=2720022 RepID=UPI0014326F1B|nr:sigma-70 family RNA polymerase sigma factor [Streptomyces sp. C1-2]NJP74941.1 sigma-70 family RNA polymerase sigma factor [Streptomyces sp. C1-2]